MHEHSDIGKFTYSNHQVSKAHGFDFPQDPNHPPQVINFEFPQEITYTPFNQPASITESVDNIDYELYYDYGNDQQRCRSELVADSDPLKTIWYNGSHEKAEINGSEYEIHYIPSASGICAIIVIENGVESIYPVYTDQLGSIVALTDVSGNVVARQQYDAWGRNRNVDDWSYDNIDPVPRWLYRGFTGHEHLRQFTLINMNGRMYDPLTTRMLSPDNFVASATGTQTLNRYIYANNNPLKYVDPNGEFAFYIPIIIGAVAGVFTGAAIQQGTGGLRGANWNTDSWNGDWWQGAITGAIVGAGIGLAVSTGLALPQESIINLISPGVEGFGHSGLTTLGWNLTSNALITANVNMASRYFQGADWQQAAVSGLVGLAAGTAGGLIGSANVDARGILAKDGIKSQNFWTNLFNGATDRLTRAWQDDLTGDNVLRNTLLGGFEGLVSAKIFSKKFLNFRIGERDTHSVLARYLSGTLSNGLTSNPGASLLIARAYGSILPGLKLSRENGSISGAYFLSPFIFYYGLSAIQDAIDGDHYPYAYPILDPSTWQ